MLRITENILLDAWLTMTIVPIAFNGAVLGIGKAIVAFGHWRKK